MIKKQLLQFTLKRIMNAALLLTCSVSIAAPNVSVTKPQNGDVIDADHVVVSGCANALSNKSSSIDLMLVIDDSSSLFGTDPTMQRFDAIDQLLNGLDKGSDINIGVVFFADGAKMEVGLQSISSVTSAVNQAIANHPVPDGGTSIASGIDVASQQLTSSGRAGATKIILVFTDGQDDPTLTEEAATKAFAQDQIVHAVALFNQRQGNDGEATIQAMTQAGGGQAFFASNTNQLASLFTSSKLVNINKVTVTNKSFNNQLVNASLVTCNYNASVDLVAGSNTLEVVAFDTEGASSSTTVTVTVPSAPVNPCDANPSNPFCPTSPSFRPVKLRPQVLMAGFDPMLIDFGDSEFKILALVREGSVPIRHVTISENTGAMNTGMTLEGQLKNGDKLYSTTFVLDRGPEFEYANLFGSKAGEFKITVIDEAQQKHSFPLLEFGNNVDLPTTTPPTQASPYTTRGIRRLSPQTLMVGFDPVMLDYTDDSFKVKAIVRKGSGGEVQHVALKSGTSFRVAMTLEDADIGNGDSMYSLVYTYPRGAFPPGAFADLFGTEYEGEFVVEAIDAAQQKHRFPALQRGNYPPQ